MAHENSNGSCRANWTWTQYEFPATIVDCQGKQGRGAIARKKLLPPLNGRTGRNLRLRTLPSRTCLTSRICWRRFDTLGHARIGLPWGERTGYRPESWTGLTGFTGGGRVGCRWVDAQVAGLNGSHGGAEGEMFDCCGVERTGGRPESWTGLTGGGRVGCRWVDAQVAGLNGSRGGAEGGGV